MRKFCLAIILLPLTLYAVGQKPLTGVFQTNFPVYGMFAETLFLNCDSSVVINSRGDITNDTSFGKWTVKRDTLILSFDSTKYPKQRYKGKTSYRIKGNRLYQFNFTKEQYKEFKVKALQAFQDSGQIIKLPSFRWFKKNTGRAMKNHNGKTGRHYFKRIEAIDCKATANTQLLQKQGFCTTLEP